MNTSSLSYRAALDRRVLTGIALMLLGYLAFSLNDAMGKWLVSGFSVAQVLLVRSIGGLLLIAPSAARLPDGALWRLERPGLQATRVLLTTLDTVLFYTAAKFLPLADVMTFYMAGPIYMAALSQMFLGERLSGRKWLAIAFGFVGVVIALRPSSAALSWPSLLGLLGSISFSASLVLSRHLRATPDPVLVTWQMVAAALTGGGLIVLGGLTDGWVPGGWTSAGTFDLMAMLGLGCVACVANLLITRALKWVPASTLAPLQYTLLLWAVILGYLFFGDLPDRQMLVGCAVIVAAGLLLLRRSP
jgi:S-adenosylmethionine uptake transporter